VIAVATPLAAWCQAGHPAATPHPATSAAGSSGASRTQTHDRNWLKKQAEKRYSGALTSPKKTEKTAKAEEKPVDK
jgi:hypothetical protein